MLTWNTNYFYVHFRRSNKGAAALQDWVTIHAQHITRWIEQAMAMAHEPTGLYNPSAYPEYFSWYHLRTRATLLGGPLPPGHIPYPEDRTRRLHILVISLINYFYNSIHSLVTSNIFK